MTEPISPPLFKTKWEAESTHAQMELEAAARTQAIETIAALMNRHRITLAEIASLDEVRELLHGRSTPAGFAPYDPFFGNR